MKNIILLICTLVAFSSCLKKEQKRNSEGSIVEMLNHNQTDAALVKIESELKINKTDELLYLKASSLSIKAGVDIYALFPLLKVKIFDVAISQWSQNREFQRKADAQKTGIDLGNKNPDEKDDGKKFVPLTGKDLDYKLKSISLTQYDEKEESCGIYLIVDSVKKFKDYNTFWIPNILNSQELCQQILKGVLDLEKFPIPTSMDKEIRKKIADDYKENWFYHHDEITKKETYVKILGSFWTIIDMVPMISKIPKVSKEGFVFLNDAQEILLKIKDTHGKKDELGEKSRKQLMMISALKIVAHVQNSVDLNLIKSPLDLICYSNDDAAYELVESERDALYLLNAIDDPEIIKKNKELFDDVKSKYKNILKDEDENPETKEKRILKLKEMLEVGKKNYCNQ